MITFCQTQPLTLTACAPSEDVPQLQLSVRYQQLVFITLNSLCKDLLTGFTSTISLSVSNEGFYSLEIFQVPQLWSFSPAVVLSAGFLVSLSYGSLFHNHAGAGRVNKDASVLWPAEKFLCFRHLWFTSCSSRNKTRPPSLLLSRLFSETRFSDSEVKEQ